MSLPIALLLACAAGTAVASVAKQLTGVDPAVAALLAGVGLGLPAVAAWNAAYGGYAGLLQPEEAFEALQVGCASLQAGWRCSRRTLSMTAEQAKAEMLLALQGATPLS